jgi:putative membrane protein
MTKLRNCIAVLALALTLIACRDEKAGQPETETTGTADAVSETSTASATTTQATGGTSSALSPDDKEFVSQAGMAGLAEVQMGNVAVQKASSADVRAYAQRMVTDHSKSNEELQQYATTKGVALPAELDAEHKNAMDHLNGLSGAEFDKAYMQHMVGDHQKAVSLFQNASTNATDTDLKNWATKTLPTLQEHLQLAETVNGKLK